MKRPGPADTRATELLGDAEPREGTVRQFRLTVLDGPAKGLKWSSTSDRCSIGSHPSNDLVIDDPAVSRFHCELSIERGRAHLRDLQSSNGTISEGIQIVDAFIPGDSLLRMGRTVVRFQFGSEQNRVAVSERTAFGSLVGTSLPMRACFALMERAAASDATALIEGETGTGKEGTARSIHGASARRDRPFITVDCSAIPETLIESELFGHEKGSFTGAGARRVGAFEEADGGTIFLDEIGELSADLQPKLLRVLEQKEIRRVGSNVHQRIDVRVVAATNRDLRAEVNAGRFRSDVYFRLAVIKLSLPPLRSRPEDIPLLIDSLLASMRATPNQLEALHEPEFIVSLQRAPWPGNIRELRNYLERCLVFDAPPPLEEPIGDAASSPSVNPYLSYEEARQRALEEFEKSYTRALLECHHGRVADAAEAAGINRAYIYRLMKRHDIAVKKP